MRIGIEAIPDAWKVFARSMQKALSTSRIAAGQCARGPWKPDVDRWEPIGKRVCETTGSPSSGRIPAKGGSFACALRQSLGAREKIVSTLAGGRGLPLEILRREVPGSSGLPHQCNPRRAATAIEP